VQPGALLAHKIARPDEDGDRQQCTANGGPASSSHLSYQGARDAPTVDKPARGCSVGGPGYGQRFAR